MNDFFWRVIVPLIVIGTFWSIILILDIRKLMKKEDENVNHKRGDRTMKYRKKPVVIEAIQFYPTMPIYEISNLFGGLDAKDRTFEKKGDVLIIKTLEGNMVCRAGDWIIKGVKGEFYPCKSEIFDLTYESCD